MIIWPRIQNEQGKLPSDESPLSESPDQSFAHFPQHCSSATGFSWLMGRVATTVIERPPNLKGSQDAGQQGDKATPRQGHMYGEFLCTTDDSGRQPSRAPQSRVGRGSHRVGPGVLSAVCAACHGQAAKGDRPLAPDLKVTLADFTQVSKKNGGEFPMGRVYRVIEGREEVKGHGTREMPIWGRSSRSRFKKRVWSRARFASPGGFWCWSSICARFRHHSLGSGKAITKKSLGCFPRAIERCQRSSHICSITRDLARVWGTRARSSRLRCAVKGAEVCTGGGRRSAAAQSAVRARGSQAENTHQRSSGIGASHRCAAQGGAEVV